MNLLGSSMFNVFSVLGILLGIILNTFIVVGNKKVLISRSNVNPSSVLHFFMGAMNLLSLGGISSGLLFLVGCPPLCPPMAMADFLNILLASLLYLQYWLIAWLCLFYFISTTTLHHKVFMWIKRRFTMFLLHLLLMSAVLSLAVSVLLVSDRLSPPQPSGNITLGSNLHHLTLHFLFSIFIGCWMPFIIGLVSAGFTASSLLIHIGNMKQSVVGFTAPQLMVYTRAIRTMTLLILLSISYYVLEILCLMSFLNPDDQSLLNWIYAVSFPTIEAAIIIQASAKLRKKLHIRCRSERRNIQNK